MIHETENSKQAAFPVAAPEGSYVADGLTKREYFAGLAMQGLIGTGAEFSDKHKVRIAELAVAHADALLAELERTTK